MKWIKKLTKTAKAVNPLKTKKNPVSAFLTNKSIVFFQAGPSKNQVLGSLIGTLDLADPSGALKSILSREEQGSTIVAPGLALPHARIDHLSGIKAAIGICPGGVTDPHDGGTPIVVFVLFLGPADNMKEHLAFLASVSALFQTDGFLAKLTTLASPEGVVHAIRQVEKQL